MHWLVVALLFSSALAAPIDEVDKELSEEGVDVNKLHSFIKSLDAEAKKEIKIENPEEFARLESEYDSTTYGNGTFVNDNPNAINLQSGIEGDLFEGDILIDEEHLKIIQEADRNGTYSRRQALKNARFHWGQAPTIPYVYAPGYPIAERSPYINAAMKFWTDNTCVQFRQGTTADKDRVVIQQAGQGCFSWVGKKGGEQPLNLDTNCMVVGLIAHELAHTFGFFHVQARNDRDNYVTIDLSNVKYKQDHNFKREGLDNTVLYDVPYEFGSVMHYADTDFAQNNQRPVIMARAGYEVWQNSMFGREPSFYDVYQMNKHFNCFARCRTQPACQNGGIVDVKNCNQCRCPKGWTGATCNQRPAGTQTLTATAQDQVLRIQMGARGARQGFVYQNQYWLIQAPAGRRIQVTAKYNGSYWSNSCSPMGVDIKFKNDQRHAGLQVCLYKNYRPIVSEGNTVFVTGYTLGEYNYAELTYRVV